MLKFDGTAVMPLFPPWQMSLTEILYVLRSFVWRDERSLVLIDQPFWQTHHSEVGTLQDATWPNFLNCLRWYSRSVQRFGK
jgi:hypothetical protein